LYSYVISMKECADLISIARRKTEFLDELSLQLCKDKIGSHQLVV